MPLMGQLRYADAEPVFLLAANGILTGSGFAEDEKRLAIGRVISLYDAWGKPDKAAEWRRSYRRRHLPPSSRSQPASPSTHRRPPAARPAAGRERHQQSCRDEVQESDRRKEAGRTCGVGCRVVRASSTSPLGELHGVCGGDRRVLGMRPGRAGERPGLRQSPAWRSDSTCP